MDISTKKIVLLITSISYFLFLGLIFYKFLYASFQPVGAIVQGAMLTLVFYITYLVLNHDIKKFERWKQQAQDFSIEDTAVVSDMSLSSTRKNGRNTVILSATYKDFELTFSGINPDFQFKYKVGDPIDIKVHPEDSQRFVLSELK